MNPQNSNESDLRQREEALRQRELELRLRELDAEVNQPPMYQTTKYRPSENRPGEYRSSENWPGVPPKHRDEIAMQRWIRQLVKVAQFMAVVIAVIVAFRIAMWLAHIVLIGVIAWVVYKVFFESDRSGS